MVMDLADVPILEEVGGYMTTKAAARELGERYQDVYYLLRMGQLKGAKLDERTWLISKRSVARYKARRAARAAETTTN